MSVSVFYLRYPGPSRSPGRVRRRYAVVIIVIMIAIAATLVGWTPDQILRLLAL